MASLFSSFSITSESTYLSDIAVHLFLQSSLGVQEIENRMNGADSGGELLEELQSPSVLRGRSLSRSCEGIIDDLNFEHDSGFSYSTTSSVNDYLAPHAACKSMNTTPNGMFSDTMYFDKSNDMHKQTAVSYFDEEKDRNSCSQLYPNSRPDSLYDDEHNTSYDSMCFGTSSDDDGFFGHKYDADDEVDKMLYEKNNNKKYFTISQEEDEDELFCFRQKSDQTIYSLERALEIIQERPKLTDRLYSQEDSDDCFRESEYDVIDTEDDLDILEVLTDVTDIAIKVRSHSCSDDINFLELHTKPLPCKNKLKIGKVKSLPKIRFPIRNGKNYRSYRTGTRTPLRKAYSNDAIDEKLTTVNDGSFSKEQLDLLSPNPTRKNNNECDSQVVTSDADYLTTVHRYSNESQQDTNLDTQAEDIAPTKFFTSMFKRRRRRSITKLDLFSNNKIPFDSRKGRFQVSTVTEVATPDIEKQINTSFEKALDLQSNLTNSQENINDEKSYTVNSINTEHNETKQNVTVAVPSKSNLYKTYPPIYHRSTSEELGIIEETVPLKTTVIENGTSEHFLLKSYEVI